MMGEDFERQPKRVCVDASSSKMMTIQQSPSLLVKNCLQKDKVNITHLLQQRAELNVWQSCVKICLIIC